MAVLKPRLLLQSRPMSLRPILSLRRNSNLNNNLLNNQHFINHRGNNNNKLINNNNYRMFNKTWMYSSVCNHHCKRHQRWTNRVLITILPFKIILYLHSNNNKQCFCNSKPRKTSKGNNKNNLNFLLNSKSRKKKSQCDSSNNSNC